MENIKTLQDEQIISVIEHVASAPKGSVAQETILKSIPGWDSMAALEFLIQLDDEWGIHIPGEDLVSCKTVADLVQMTKQHLTA